MFEYQINVERFNEIFSLDWREIIAMFVHKVVKGVEKSYPSFYDGYWNTLGKAFNRYEALPQGIPILDDLFPPNIAILDWLLEMGVDKQTGIADIPCGLGNLMFYLKELDFENVWGYDKWNQIEKERAEKFLKLTDVQGCLVDLPTILTKPIDIIISVALPFDWLAEDIALLIARAKYILVDTSYLPAHPIEGFEEVGRYLGLLVVYKKVEKTCDESQ